MIDVLAKRMGRYALVVGVAKRARDLKERIESALEPAGGGLIKRALEEIATGQVRVREEKPEDEAQ